MKPCAVCPHPNTEHFQVDGDCVHKGCHCKQWQEVQVSFYLAEDNMLCLACDRVILAGQPYKERLESMDGDTPVFELVCVYC